MDDAAATVRDWCRRLEKIFVPAVADALDGMGFRDQYLSAGFWPLLPNSTIAGPAFTVREVAAPTLERRSTEEKLRIFSEFFGSLQPGQVVVVDTGGCSDAAAWGELMSTISKFTCGASGAVIDGAVRDVSRMIGLEFPVWYRSRVPSDSEGRLQLLDFDKPIPPGHRVRRSGWNRGHTNVHFSGCRSADLTR
jgi:regulator of RNase E activity RraA